MSKYRSSRRVLRRSGLAIGALSLLACALPSSAYAASLPFSDPNAQGSIGLCDAAGHSIQAGSALNHPFVVAAGSTVAAPQGYDSKAGGKATLYAFQPRKDVDPGQWSGYQLTGASIYADVRHPLVAGTNIDPSLQDFVTSFPAKWDGLVELRIFYTAPNKVVYRRNYPAAVVRVQAGKWTVVQAANLTCDLAKVVSNEKLVLPASAFDPAHPAVTDAPQLAARTTSAPSGAKASTTASSTAKRPSTAPTSAGQSSLADAADASAKSGSGSSAPWLALVVAGLGITGIAAAVGWRARQQAQR